VPESLVEKEQVPAEPSTRLDLGSPQEKGSLVPCRKKGGEGGEDLFLGRGRKGKFLGGEKAWPSSQKKPRALEARGKGLIRKTPSFLNAVKKKDASKPRAPRRQKKKKGEKPMSRVLSEPRKGKKPEACPSKTLRKNKPNA